MSKFLLCQFTNPYRESYVETCRLFAPAYPCLPNLVTDDKMNVDSACNAHASTVLLSRRTTKTLVSRGQRKRTALYLSATSSYSIIRTMCVDIHAEFEDSLIAVLSQSWRKLSPRPITKSNRLVHLDL